jgi:hypothetical protein
MTNLNTQQIVLLCLLVSFVTAITTGITTISLLQQAPEPVSQTINRVIERTVETVTQQPIEEIKNIVTPEPQKEVVTVVVNQEDQSINAVEKNEKSLVRLVTNNSGEEFIALGVVLNQAGDIIVDKRSVNTRAFYKAQYAQGTYEVQFDQTFQNADFAIFKIRNENPNNFNGAVFGDSNNLRLAQSVISLSGSDSASVSIGEISNLTRDIENSLTSIKTSVSAQNVLPGSMLLNLSGAIIGFRVNIFEDRTVFIPINILKKAIGI